MGPDKIDRKIMEMVLKQRMRAATTEWQKVGKKDALEAARMEFKQHPENARQSMQMDDISNQPSQNGQDMTEDEFIKDRLEKAKRRRLNWVHDSEEIKSLYFPNSKDLLDL